MSAEEIKVQLGAALQDLDLVKLGGISATTELNDALATLDRATTHLTVAEAMVIEQKRGIEEFLNKFHVITAGSNSYEVFQAQVAFEKAISDCYDFIDAVRIQVDEINKVKSALAAHGSESLNAASNSVVMGLEHIQAYIRTL